MLQIRVANFDGTDSVVLDRASNRKYAKAINSADSGVTFEIAKHEEKSELLNPYTDGYIRRWEVWETVGDELLNYGPITNISDNVTTWGVTGAGRAALLADYRKSLKTFYSPIYTILEEVSYENLAAQPRTTTIVPDVTTSAAQTTVFGNTVIINEKYHGLSKNSKDRAIDDDAGGFKIGDVEPSNTYWNHDSYWSGMSVADTHIIDLGDVYDLNRIVLTLPSWGGAQRLANRTYDYEVAIATDEGSTTEVQDREFGTFTTIHSTTNPSVVVGGVTLYIGTDQNDDLQVEVKEASDAMQAYHPVPVRYIRTKISDVHAWFGTHFDDDASVDGWEYQCDPDYDGGIPNKPEPVMADPINDRVIEPANDCHASIAEVAANKRIVELNDVKPLALQRIDNNNLQITYSYTPLAAMTKTTNDGYRKFEPGSLFRKATLSYSAAAATTYKFFPEDCSNCYPDGFRFGIMDQDNSLVYATDTTSGTPTVKLGAFTKHMLMKGAANATVTWCDAWKARTDPLSFGGSYSFNEETGDTAVIHFRGQSFRWYATVPDNKTGAEVNIHIRSKTSSTWSSYSLLDTITLPSGIAAQVVYEITYESGQLQPDTIYEIRLTNVDGNFISIDSIEGYWSSVMTEYNEDSSRIFINQPTSFKQIYDKRFSNGSMFKQDAAGFSALEFTGDRVIVVSAKGRYHGAMRVLILDESIQDGVYDPGNANHVFIPGGNLDDGSLTINLDTGKRGNEITQAIIFDSNDYFSGGLPWGKYTIGMYYLIGDINTFSSNTADVEFDSFVPRCKECTPPTGEDITVNRPVFLDGIFCHELLGLSVTFDTETHLEILKGTAEATQSEWLVDARGIIFEPRIGTDTNEYMREGENTVVNWDIENDISEMATILLSYGADIDGLPLYTMTEDKETRARMGRTIMRQEDFRNLGSYFQLIGASRASLKKRSYPDKRIQVSFTDNKGLDVGDSFVLWTRKSGDIRVRIIRHEIDESSGRVYNTECVTWPQII